MSRGGRGKNILLSYIRDRRCVSIVWAVCGLLLSFVHQLYGLPWEPLVYGLAICLTVGLGAAAVDLYGHWRRHTYLVRMQAEVSQGLPDLPKPRDLVEEDLFYLLETLWEEKERCLLAGRREQEEALDYYMLWTHQVKTPIAAMRLICQGEDTQMGRDLQAELFKIEQYVEMALSYVRLGSSSTDYVFRRYPLDDLVRQAVRKYASLFIQKKIRLDLKPLDGQVVTDEKWLVFVIGQILSNALKYTSKGCISIYQEGEDVLVIQDTGIGIAPEDLPRIWEKGFTGYNGREDKRATGIGMYLCKRVLEDLSHTIAVTSQVGKGTKVSIGFVPHL